MKYIVPVFSGKGGVGKSSVSVNLALALAELGYKTALLDADFYGPSIPTMLGGGDIKVDHNEKLIPPLKFGVKYISLGFFLSNPDDAVIWRGPMFNKALAQLFNDVSWGDVDICIIDMPPGTGDAQLSLAQMVQLSGGLIVTTPQEVSLTDVRKAINMLSKVNVDVLGIVENMAGFTAPDGSHFDLFGSGGGQQLADKFNLPLLCSIPILPEIREGADAGVPAVTRRDSQSSKIFKELAQKVLQILETRQQQAQPELRIVN